MDIVEVRFKIVFIFDRMLPESTLPNATPMLAFLSSRDRCIATSARQKSLRKVRLDHAPASGIVGIARGQCPECVQMVRQQHQGVDFERPVPLAITNDSTQQRPIRHTMKQSPSPMSDDSKEKRAARNVCATVVRHAGNVADEEGRREPALLVWGILPQPPVGTQPGDIDVLTESFAIEVKKGPPGNYFSAMTRAELLL